LARQVITISRTKYATDLFWQPIVGGQSIRVFAGNLGNFITGRTKYYTTFKSIVGVGSSALGHRTRMPSAAATIMDAFSEYNSFVAAFKVNGGIYIVAARSGIIIHDRFYASEDVGHTEFDTLLSLPDWGAVIAPNEWNVARAEEKQIEELIAAGTKHLLLPTSRFWNNFISIALLVGLLLGVLYLFGGQVKKIIVPGTPDIAVDEAARAAFLRRLEVGDATLTQAVRVMGPPTVITEMPFDNIPDLSARAEQCMNAITFLMQTIPGWVQQEAVCTEEYATVHLHRRHGALSDVWEYVIEFMPGIEITENSESDIVLTYTLSPLYGISRMEESDGQTVARHINSIFQLMGHPVDVRQSVETVRSAARVDVVNVVLVSATSALQPGEFIQIFKDYDAVVLYSVRWTSSTRRWNYEVKIYVN